MLEAYLPRSGDDQHQGRQPTFTDHWRLNSSG